MNKWITAIFCSSLLINCAGTQGLKNAFGNKQSTLGYLNDSNVELKKNVSIGNYTLSSDLLAGNEVKRIKSVVVPLLIINFWDHDFLVTLGNSGVDNSISNFGKESLINDLKRAGARIGESSEINIDVNITKIKSSSDYFKNGYFYFFLFVYGYGWGYGSRSINSELEAEINININGVQKKINFVHNEKAIVPKQRKDDDLAQKITNAMVEILSLCFKEMNNKIISSISEN